MYIYIYICVCHIYMYIYIYTYIYIYICTCASIYAYMCVYVCIYIYICVCVLKLLYIKCSCKNTCKSASALYMKLYVMCFQGRGHKASDIQEGREEESSHREARAHRAQNTGHSKAALTKGGANKWSKSLK